jgi:Cu(I)/Ag(I) efflux system membrane fusion protein
MMNREGDIVATGHGNHANSGEGYQTNRSDRASSALTSAFQSALLGALDPYFKMKDALVEGDPEQVKTHAETANKLFQGLPTTGLSPDRKNLIARCADLFADIAGSPNIERQRTGFVLLNRALIGIVMGFRDLEKPIYIQHCPMANNNEGAQWLSLEREIRNPYYGTAMPGCGSVTDSIQ